jgi:hypothetical protein
VRKRLKNNNLEKFIMFSMQADPRFVRMAPKRKYSGAPRKVFLFTNARDERHLNEWIAHHLLLGFNHIHIFDHKSSPPIHSPFSPRRVSVERCTLENPVKIPLMKRAVRLAKGAGCDWMLYLDADEFLILNAFTHIQPLLRRFSHAHSLSLNWVMFGSSHHIQDPPPEKGVMESYTKSNPKIDQHVKTFVRPHEVFNITNAHNYHIFHREHMFNVDGQVMKKSDGDSFHPVDRVFNHHPAYIAHYHYQSEETYLRRKATYSSDDGTGVRPPPTPDFHSHNNDVENQQALKYVENVNRLLSRF